MSARTETGNGPQKVRAHLRACSRTTDRNCRLDHGPPLCCQQGLLAGLTLDCLVMLNLFTRPPVRPAAATQLPQLLHSQKQKRGARAGLAAAEPSWQHHGLPAA